MLASEKTHDKTTCMEYLLPLFMNLIATCFFLYTHVHITHGILHRKISVVHKVYNVHGNKLLHSAHIVTEAGNYWITTDCKC